MLEIGGEAAVSDEMERLEMGSPEVESMVFTFKMSELIFGKRR